MMGWSRRWMQRLRQQAAAQLLVREWGGVGAMCLCLHMPLHPVEPRPVLRRWMPLPAQLARLQGCLQRRPGSGVAAAGKPACAVAMAAVQAAQPLQPQLLHLQPSESATVQGGAGLAPPGAW